MRPITSNSTARSRKWTANRRSTSASNAAAAAGGIRSREKPFLEWIDSTKLSRDCRTSSGRGPLFPDWFEQPALGQLADQVIRLVVTIGAVALDECRQVR